MEAYVTFFYSKMFCHHTTHIIATINSNVAFSENAKIWPVLIKKAVFPITIKHSRWFFYPAFMFKWHINETYITWQTCCFSSEDSWHSEESDQGCYDQLSPPWACLRPTWFFIFYFFDNKSDIPHCRPPTDGDQLSLTHSHYSWAHWSLCF